MARVETTRLQFDIEINGKKVERNIGDIKKAYRTLGAQVNKLTEGSAEYNKKVAEMAKLNSVLTDHRKKIRGISDEVNNGTTRFGKFGNAIKGIGAKITAGFGPVGLILSAITALIGFGKAAVESAREMGLLAEKTNQVTGLIGEELQKATAKASALSKTFETDVTRGIDAANAAANAFVQPGQEIGEVYISSLDKIGERLLALPGKGDEFLDQVVEYSSVAEEAGLSMDRFFNLVAEGINRGVPTDKLIDSIKEFDIRIKTITKGQKDTLNQVFGQQFADQLVEDIETGKKTSIEALEELSGQIAILGDDSADAKKVISDLFGGPGEDATAKFIGLINEVDDSLESVINTQNVYIQRKQELLEKEQLAAEAAAELNFQLDGSNEFFKTTGLTIKAFFLNALANVVETIRYFPEYFQAATSSGKAFINTIISGYELLFVKINPVAGLLEKVLGVEIKIPKFDIEDDPFGQVEAKIEADRKAFAERQRQKALEEQGKTEAAKRLRELQAEKARQEQLEKLNDAEKEKMIKLQEEAARKIEDLKLALMEEGLEKQIKLAELRAQREIKALKGSAEQIAEQKKLIEDKLDQDIEALRTAARDKRTEEEKKQISEEEKEREDSYKRRLEALKQWHEQELTLITQKAITDIEAGISVEDADALMKERMLVKLQEFLEKREALEKEFNLDNPDTDQEKSNLELEEFRRKEAEKLAIRKENWDKAISIAESASSIIGSFSDLILANTQRRFEEELAMIEKKEAAALKAAGDNEAKKAKIREKFEKQSARIREQQAKAEQKAAISRAIIDGSLAVMRIAADVPKVDFGITTALMIAAQVAATAAQIGIIKSQVFKEGGKLPILTSGIQPGQGGIPVGPSHQEGHIYLVDGKSGRVAGAVEGGEPILSTETYKNNPHLVDMLLDSSMNRGGKSIENELREYFFEGKSIPGKYQPGPGGAQKQPVNIIYKRGGFLPQLRPHIWEDGGILSGAPSTTPTQTVIESTTGLGIDQGIKEDIQKLIEVTRNNRFILMDDASVETLARKLDEMAKEKENLTLES